MPVLAYDGQRYLVIEVTEQTVPGELANTRLFHVSAECIDDEPEWEPMVPFNDDP